MKNPLVWLFKKPESLGYIFFMAWCIFTTIEFNMEHLHAGFPYYLQMFLGCLYIGVFLYLIFMYNYRKYHKIIWLITTWIYFISIAACKLAYQEPEGFTYYFRITAVCIFSMALIFTLMKYKRFINE